MKRHFVTFSSPGTMLAEQSTKPIDSWDVNKAVEMSKEIKERHGATPYAFHFTTRGREDHELDSKVIKTSNQYFLGGKIETLKQVKSRNSPNDDILIRNMENNGYDKVITTTEGWRSTQPLRSDDVVLQV